MMGEADGQGHVHVDVFIDMMLQLKAEGLGRA